MRVVRELKIINGIEAMATEGFINEGTKGLKLGTVAIEIINTFVSRGLRIMWSTVFKVLRGLMLVMLVVRGLKYLLTMEERRGE